MPIKQAAKKALRQTQKRTARNLKIREDIQTLLKKTRKAISSKESKDKIEANLKQAQKSLDKAVQKGVLKKNTASRKLSRLMKFYHQGSKVVKKEVEKVTA